MVIFMEKRTMGKRCIAWILTLVMVLNVVNLPAFTLGVKAEEAATEYTVTFDPDGGTWSDETTTGNKTVSVNENETIGNQKPENPTKTGYRFDYWYEEKEGNTEQQFDFNTQITGNVTLKAKWVEVVTVTFNSDGGTFSGNASVTIDKGSTVQKPSPDPTKQGYQFAGWYKGEQLFDFNTSINETTELKAKWKQLYTVTFNPDNGSSQTTESVADGDTVKAPSTPPTKRGHKFLNWCKDNNPFDFNTPITGDITLIAKWEKKTYTIKCDPNGGNLDGKTEAKTYQYKITDNKFTLATPTRTGYTFEGWKCGDETEVKKTVTIDPESYITKDTPETVTYTAQWKANGISVEVDDPDSYVYNGEEQKPEVIVTDTVTKGRLVKGEDYTVTYANNTDAGEATVTVTGTGSYKDRNGEAKFTIKQGNPDPKYTPVTAYCGQKLSEIPINSEGAVKGQFKWNYTDGNTENTVLSDGKEYTIQATFEPEDKKNYESKTVEIVVKPAHDFVQLTGLEHQVAKAVDEKGKKAGSREYYHCMTCGKYYDAAKNEQAKEYFTVPYVEKSITVTLGSGNTSINKYVTDGMEGVASQVMENPSKYKKYVTFDQATGTIKTPKSAKYYKKKINQPKIVVTDKAGGQYSVKVNLQIAKPTVKVSKKAYTSVGGIKSYKYTIKCSANSADQFSVKVVSGLAKSSTKKSLNKALKTRCNSQFKIKKKKATTTITFTIAKTSIKKKLSFQVYAKYGVNKSATKEVSR